MNGLKMRRWILFTVVVFVTAAALRFLLPPRLGHSTLSFRSGGVVRALPSNLVAFWLVLAIGGIVALIAIIAGRAHR
jgi:hypothetical protein